MFLEALMKRISLSLAALTIAALTAAPGAALAADPTGMWLSQDGDVKMKVSHCGGNICGVIAWLKQPNDESGRPKTDKNNADAGKRNRPVIGVPIVLGMQPDGADKWSGQVYNAEDGKTYSGGFALSGPTQAVLKGCIMIICKSKTWTRSH
jgi:uncharacterized protein (DUF2147 family)